MIMVPGDVIARVRPRRFRGTDRDGDPRRTASVLPLHEARERFERDYILRTLAAQHGNMSRTADVLGVERSNLYRKMRAFGIAPSRRGSDASPAEPAESSDGVLGRDDPGPASRP